MLDRVVTTQLSPGVHACYPAVEATDFNPLVFDENELAAKQLLDGSATAGRGNTWFFRWADRQLVLRHCRRGGLIRHISKDRYVFTGLNRTRAFRELDILLKLQQLQLPAPQPYACKIVRHGLTYSASLITYRLLGYTLAEQLNNGLDDDVPWGLVGQVIGRFHRAGLCHADLNAHNIIIGEDNSVSLIDFDRANFYAPLDVTNNHRWGLRNLNRLHQSLIKNSATNKDIASPTGKTYQHQFTMLKQRWMAVLSGIEGPSITG